MAGDIPHYPHWLLSEAQEMVKTFRESPKAKSDEFRIELEAIYLLHAAKRSDYTGDGGDPLANYRFSSGMVGLPIERGMLMRLSEKIFRLKSILVGKDGETRVADETLADTCRDIATIAILMKLAIDGKAYGAPKETA